MAGSRGMGRTASTVGMMEGAFFVSRTDLLQWVNSLLQVNLTKVEQCASGAIYCQIIDACHPNSVAMRKVNWMAKTDHEFLPNYKILQAAFDKNCIEKHVDVDKLVRAKYQDNLEFLQWLKCYWEREGSGRRDYDPVAAREGKHLPAWARALGDSITSTGASFERGGEKENLHPRPAEGKRAGSLAGPAARPRPVVPAAKTPRSCNTSLANTSFSTSASADGEEAASKERCSRKLLEEARAKVTAQSEELQELRVTLDALERERDYYFRKLRGVEIVCTTLQQQMDPGLTAEKIIADIQGILYAETDEVGSPGPADSLGPAPVP